MRQRRIDRAEKILRELTDLWADWVTAGRKRARRTMACCARAQ